MFDISIKTKISDYLHDHSLLKPEHDAVVYGKQRLSYAELSTQVNRCAKALLAKGVEKGDRVAVLCTSRTEYWVTFLAATQVGAIWMGLNPKHRLQELEYVIDDAKPKILFAMAGFGKEQYSPNILALRERFSFIESLISLTDPLPDSSSYADFISLGDSISDQSLLQRQTAIDRMDPALLVYTSGSTGKPKGALLSHYSLCFGSTVAGKHYDLIQPRIVCNFPINHVACIADTCCANLVAGGTIVFQERFDPASYLNAISKEGLTMVACVPTMLLMLLDHVECPQTDFSSVELIAWGGAAMPVDTIERLQSLAPRLLCAYGMTETAANTTYTSPEADRVELTETIGRPSPYMPCRIVNSDGKICEIGEHGELQFKGDYLLLEYLNRPDATSAVYTEDSWLHTGDLGYWRDNGAISLVGRLSDMFKSGGYNVYPREIEEVLESHPDIDMAAVISVPDERFQEVGVAFCRVLKNHLNVQLINDFCRDHLANYKIPKTFIVMDELPVLPVGKIDKVSLKKWALEQQQDGSNKEKI